MSGVALPNDVDKGVDEGRWFDICQLADYLLEEKEKTGITPEISSQEVYVLVRHMPEERKMLENLEKKVGGPQNLIYLCAAAVCGPEGMEGMRVLLKQFDDMLVPASYASPEVPSYTRETSTPVLEDDCLDDEPYLLYFLCDEPLDEIIFENDSVGDLPDQNSLGLDFEQLYRAAREQREKPVYDAKIVNFPEN